MAPVAQPRCLRSALRPISELRAHVSSRMPPGRRLRFPLHANAWTRQELTTKGTKRRRTFLTVPYAHPFRSHREARIPNPEARAPSPELDDSCVHTLSSRNINTI